MAKRNLLTFADLSDNMKNALRILRDGKTRSTMEIQKALLIPVTTLRKALNRLHLFELVEEIQHHHGNQWLIAYKGTELLSQNEQYFDKSETIEVFPETNELLNDNLKQETVVCIPCEKNLKQQEKLTLEFVAFWLKGKAQEFNTMAEMILSQI